MSSAAAKKAEVDVLQFTSDLRDFASINKGHKKYAPGSYRMLHRVLIEASLLIRRWPFCGRDK